MKHFLDVSDYSPAEIQDILDLAIRLKKEYFVGDNHSCSCLPTKNTRRDLGLISVIIVPDETKNFNKNTR